MGGDAFDEFQFMNSTPNEAEDDDTGIWTLDGKVFEDQVCLHAKRVVSFAP